MRVSTLAAALISTTMMTTAASANSDMLFILDGSGSMWGQIEGVAKIQTAKDTMSKLMDDMPSDARIGLMTYGTRDKQSCKDVVSLNPLGYDRQKIKNSIADIKPLGKTPIEFALVNGISLLANTAPNDVPKSLVLVSDGIETCDGNPCSIAMTSQFSGVDMKVHVVGFDVDAKAREQLECIAKAGKGQYFDAANPQGFQDAMQAVVEVAQAEPEPEPEPVVEEPKGLTITEFFRDDFDGEELAEHWEITNPDPDSFIVENGGLLMLSTSPTPFSDESSTNLITYKGEMPDGDWDAVITFTGEMSATLNTLDLGLHKDTENFLTAKMVAGKYSACTAIGTRLTKTASGSGENIAKSYRNSSNAHCGRVPFSHENADTILNDVENKAHVLTFSKRGRSYYGSLQIEGLNLEDDTPYIGQTDQFTSLRSPGELKFAIGREAADYSGAKGEALINIDSFVINTVEE